MNLLSMLGGNAFVMFNKELAHKVSVNGSIIFGQLCSSYESFGKKNMLTKYQGKEYFFLTSEVIQVETALTYKQQLTAIKLLEELGYIETVIMGQPAKKFFHITRKIFEQFYINSSSDKKEELKEEMDQKEEKTNELDTINKNSSYDKKEKLDIPKGNDKPLPFGSAYKENNKKEKYKKNKYKLFVNKIGNNNNKLNINNDLNKKTKIENNNDLEIDNDSDKRNKIINELSIEYMQLGLYKKVILKVVDEVQNTPNIKNFGAYLRTCLENALYKVGLKTNSIVPEYESDNKIPSYNWLSKSEENEITTLEIKSNSNNSLYPSYNWCD